MHKNQAYSAASCLALSSLEIYRGLLLGFTLLLAFLALLIRMLLIFFFRFMMPLQF